MGYAALKVLSFFILFFFGVFPVRAATTFNQSSTYVGEPIKLTIQLDLNDYCRWASYELEGDAIRLVAARLTAVGGDSQGSIFDISNATMFVIHNGRVALGSISRPAPRTGGTKDLDLNFSRTVDLRQGDSLTVEVDNIKVFRPGRGRFNILFANARSPLTIPVCWKTAESAQNYSAKPAPTPVSTATPSSSAPTVLPTPTSVPQSPSPILNLSPEPKPVSLLPFELPTFERSEEPRETRQERPPSFIVRPFEPVVNFVNNILSFFRGLFR